MGEVNLLIRQYLPKGFISTSRHSIWYLYKTKLIVYKGKMDFKSLIFVFNKKIN